MNTSAASPAEDPGAGGLALPQPCVIVDVETTGAHPVRDRITEIAVLRIEDGVVVERWESLVNPGRAIPRMIQDLIGITDEMVAGAPSFAELAGRLRALLSGCVFVAHNARFDYGFIRNEFVRIGEDFEAPVLCTVKLSRALYPEHHRHGLDALIERHGLQCSARHRAMGDTEVLWQFARLVQAGFPADRLAAAVQRAMKQPARPPGLPEGALAGLPDAPGVYLCHGEGGRLLQVGRASSLRARVTELLVGGGGGRVSALAQAVRELDWRETAGELESQLLEARLVRELRPLHNRQPTPAAEVFALRVVPGRRRGTVVQRVALAGSDPAHWEALYGVFLGRKEADNLLRELALLYQLCPRRLGLEAAGSGACSARIARRCAGVCAGRESVEAHDARLTAALQAARGQRAWPWPSAVVVHEQCATHGRRISHLLDHWCWLGSAEDAAGLQALIEMPPARVFDAEVYRILGRWLVDPAQRDAVRPVG